MKKVFQILSSQFSHKFLRKKTVGGRWSRRFLKRLTASLLTFLGMISGTLALETSDSSLKSLVDPDSSSEHAASSIKDSDHIGNIVPFDKTGDPEHFGDSREMAAQNSGWGFVEGHHVRQNSSMSDALTSTDSDVESKPLWEQLDWGFTAGGFLQGNSHALNHLDSQTDGCFSADLGCLVPLGEKGVFYGLAECGYGAGLDGRLASFAGFIDEIEPEERLRLTEAWYERAWGSGWRFRVGQVDLMTDFDTNLYANCGYDQFNSSGFVNNLAIDVPDNTIGTMLWKDLNETVSVGAGYQSTNEWNDIFSHGFGLLELNLHTDWNGLKGTYRFYGWLNDWQGYEKTNTGWGGSFDQEVTQKLGVWSRLGIQDDQLNDFDTHLSVGLELHHWVPDREDDLLGIGYGIATLSSSFRENVEEESGNEHFWEAYYRYQLNDEFRLNPFIQWVKNPAGDQEIGDIWILGIRGVIAL